MSFPPIPLWMWFHISGDFVAVIPNSEGNTTIFSVNNFIVLLNLLSAKKVSHRSLTFPVFSQLQAFALSRTERGVSSLSLATYLQVLPCMEEGLNSLAPVIRWAWKSGCPPKICLYRLNLCILAALSQPFPNFPKVVSFITVFPPLNMLQPGQCM